MKRYIISAAIIISTFLGIGIASASLVSQSVPPPGANGSVLVASSTAVGSSTWVATSSLGIAGGSGSGVGSTTPWTSGGIVYQNGGSISASSSFTTDGSKATSTAYQTNNTTTPSFSNGANLDSYQFAASGTPSGFSEYGAYLNSLCASVASGTTIYIPQGTFNVSSTITLTQHCSYRGVGGGGTILNWTGATSSVLIQENWGTTPHVSGGGLFGLTLQGNNSQSTSTEIGLLEGGNSGATHAINDGLTIKGFGKGYSTATNTYMSDLSNTVLVGNAVNVNIASPSNSGESMDFFNVQALDPANNNATATVEFNANSLENGVWSGGSIDDSGVDVQNGNNMTFIGVNFENPGYPTYGAYIPINMASSFYGTVITNIGGNMQNDSPQTTTTPAEFVNIGGTYNSYGVELARNNSSAQAVAQYVNNGNSTVNGIANVCNTLNQNNSGNAVTSIFPAGNTSNAENWGCLNWTQNNYIQGVDYTSGNSNFYTHGGIAASLLNGTGAFQFFDNILLGTSGTTPGCAEWFEAGATSTKLYQWYASGGKLSTSTSNPGFCP